VTCPTLILAALLVVLILAAVERFASRPIDPRGT
jgi:hypothetical protein